jgi:hypothetical protein
MLSTVRKGFGLAGSMSASIGHGPGEVGGAPDTAPPLPVPRQPRSGAVPSTASASSASTGSTPSASTATAPGNPTSGSWLERLEQLERQPSRAKPSRRTRRARRKMPRGSVWLSRSVWLSWPGRPGWLANRKGLLRPRLPWGRRAGVLVAGTATALLLMGGAGTLLVTRDSGRTATASLDLATRPDAALAVTTLAPAGTGPDVAAPAPMALPQPAVPAVAPPRPATPARPAVPAAPAAAAPAQAPTSGAHAGLPSQAPQDGRRLSVPALPQNPSPRRTHAPLANSAPTAALTPASRGDAPSSSHGTEPAELHQRPANRSQQRSGRPGHGPRREQMLNAGLLDALTGILDQGLLGAG